MKINENSIILREIIIINKMILRQQKILELLTEKEEFSVTELSDKLNVTEVTIRTDLNSLAEDQKVIRTHGKVRLLAERIKAENSFEVRKRQNFNQKVKIGKAASQLIESHDTVLLDSSSTALTLAISMRERDDLQEVTAIPTGIWTALELMGMNEIEVLLPGGYLRHTSGSITGLPTKEFLKDLNIQKAFLGAWGISYNKGFMDSHLLEIELKKYVINCAEEVIILADGSKFNQSGLATYANINEVTSIITDESAPKEILNKFRRRGVKIFIA